MYYYYDVYLNFGIDDEVYEFYEWEEKDTIEFVKKMPVFRVSTESLLDILNHKVKFSSSLVLQIKGKTMLKSSLNSIIYAFILSDTKNALAFELNEEGFVIARSRLLPSDELNLLEILFTMKESTLEYEKIEPYCKQDTLRQVREIKQLIKCEIDTLYENKNTNKLKYLYYEWFDKSSNDINRIYNEMTETLQKEYDSQLKNIYDFIKMSYNKVN